MVKEIAISCFMLFVLVQIKHNKHEPRSSMYSYVPLLYYRVHQAPLVRREIAGPLVTRETRDGQDCPGCRDHQDHRYVKIRYGQII